MKRGTDETNNNQALYDCTYNTPTQPYLVAVGLIHPYHGSKSFERLRVKGLGQSICNHVFSRPLAGGNLS